MSRFNSRAATINTPNTTNVAGGLAFKASTKLDLASRLMSSMLQDTFYKTGAQSEDELAALVAGCEDPLFAAKAAVYARHKGYLRSVTHVVAAEIAARVKGERWTRPFFQAVVYRPDDVTEILSAFQARHGAKFPNALKDGLGKALSTFDAYQLAKYRGAGKSINLMDAVNICHPKSNEHLTALMKGTLKPAETWEVKVSAAGKTEDKTAAKQEAWADLIKDRKLGYLAALRNLRNIQEQAPASLNAVLEFISDPEQVRKSKVLPFQFHTAVRVMRGALSNGQARMLGKALGASLANVPKLPGSTLVVIDVSGSMRGMPIEHASLLGGVLWKTQDDADLMLFDTQARYVKGLNPDDTLITVVGAIQQRATGGSTYFAEIFREANRAYDRIIILSDMQGYGDFAHGALQSYRKRMKCDPLVYSFNVQATDGTLQFPEPKVRCLSGWSDNVLATITNLEADPQAFIKEIDNVEFNSYMRG